jgi:hypothetical protein
MSANFSFKRTAPSIILIASLLFFALAASQPAHAQYAETLPYTFAGANDGAGPAAALIFDSKGNLYGTAVNGGDIAGVNCPGLNPPTGCGVVFELSPPSGGTGPWTETVLYTFTGGSDGAYPQAGLIFDSNGNLYGSTSNGGNMSGTICHGLGGCGVVFQLSPPKSGSGPWTETPIYTFTGKADGAVPYASLIFDAWGNLYSTTAGGGLADGVVFELTPPKSGSGPWTQTVLYSFTGDTDGGDPVANVIFDTNGNLYGTTTRGGNTTLANCSASVGCGVVFELSPPSGGSGPWTETPLYTFTGNTDGSYPYSGLTIDSHGNLYGTTAIGGAKSGAICKRTNGCGVVYEMSPPNGGSGDWTETVLYRFGNSIDGGYPYAGVIFDSGGNLYGTTVQGGNTSGANCSAYDGCGVVFELSPPAGSGLWSETAAYTFNGGSDGGFPYAAPILDAQGNIYGTASSGGNMSGSNCMDVGGCGVAFELTHEAGPVVKLSPVALIFGDTIVGTTSAAKTVKVSNTGETTLDISSITASTKFAISANTCGATLEVGKSCKVSVTFKPTQVGEVTGTLTFTDNAINSPQNVQLSGTGVLPATLTPASATYKKQPVGTTSAAKKFTLTNNQSVSLTSIAISTTGDFAVSTTTCGTTLASKQKCTINVTFTPTKTGTRTGQLTVSDNAGNSPQTSSLTGTGD